MYSGVPGRGAQDAWMLRALHIEALLVEAIPFAGDGIDIYKCFDQQMLRHILLVAVVSGFPLKLGITIVGFMENAVYHAQLPDGLGPLPPHTEEMPLARGPMEHVLAGNVPQALDQAHADHERYSQGRG